MRISRPIRRPPADSRQPRGRHSSRWDRRGVCFFPTVTELFSARACVSQRERDQANGIRAYRARRDCGSPVPLITTSHFVSERDSMVVVVRGWGRGKKKRAEFCTLSESLFLQHRRDGTSGGGTAKLLVLGWVGPFQPHQACSRQICSFSFNPLHHSRGVLSAIGTWHRGFNSFTICER